MLFLGTLYAGLNVHEPLEYKSPCLSCSSDEWQTALPLYKHSYLGSVIRLQDLGFGLAVQKINLQSQLIPSQVDLKPTRQAHMQLNTQLIISGLV